MSPPFDKDITNTDDHLEIANIQAATISDSTTLCAVTTQRVTFSRLSMYLSRNKSVEAWPQEMIGPRYQTHVAMASIVRKDISKK